MSRRRQFEANGFITVPAFVDDATLRELRAELSQFLATTVATLPRAEVYCEVAGDLTTLKQVQHLDRHAPRFAELLHEGPFPALAADLLGERVHGKNIQFLDKPPAQNLGTPPHQDGYYFMLQPPRAVTLWLALDNVGLDQGCVRYLPGSHRHGIRRHDFSEVLGFSQHIVDFGPADSAAEQPCPCAAGDLLAHHALTVHRALANSATDTHRRALALIYYAASAQEDHAAHEAYQHRLAARLAEQNKI